MTSKNTGKDTRLLDGLHLTEVMILDFLTKNSKRAKGIQERFNKSSLPSLLLKLGFIKVKTPNGIEVFAKNIKNGINIVSFCTVTRTTSVKNDLTPRTNTSHFMVTDVSISEYLRLLFDTTGKCSPEKIVLPEFVDKFTPVYNLRHSIDYVS